MRVAIGGISHETNTFSSIQTDLSLFQRRTLIRGQAMIESSRGVGNTLGGMVDTALALGWDLVPTLFTSATPSGRVKRSTFESLANDLVHGLGAAHHRQSPLDGVLLALHGAMVVEALDDADAELLRRVRQIIGPQTPLAVVLDSHANITPAMVAQVDIMLAYESYPHLDTYARGADAVTLLQRLQRGAFRPVHALRQIPMLTPLPSQWADGPTPMRALALLVRDLRHTPGVVSIALAGGFPYSDIHDAGMAVVVTADGDAALAEQIAEQIAAACWERREEFRCDLTSIADAVALADASSEGPVVLADVADNPGAGGSGDGTAILAELLRVGVAGAALGVIADPETVSAAAALGVGQRGHFRLGGKVDNLHGPPLNVSARVRWVGHCHFTNAGPMGAGATTRLGHTAVLEIGDEGAAPVEVIVCENRVQVLDPELFRAVGIEPESRRVLVVKSSVHYRAAFESLAARLIDVNGPGLSSPDLTRFTYRRVRRPIWPLDEQFSR